MQTRVYKAGSIVYFAGDTSDRVYILKQGQAQSIFLSEETGYETREIEVEYSIWYKLVD